MILLIVPLAINKKITKLEYLNYARVKKLKKVKLVCITSFRKTRSAVYHKMRDPN